MNKRQIQGFKKKKKLGSLSLMLPFLEGYFQGSLNVKKCLSSILASTVTLKTDHDD
jgi:hypothetical protein